MNTNVIDFIHTNRDRYISELKHYLAIPSISALPQHHDDVKRCAQWTADEMTRIGLENVRLIDTPGNPVVYGDWLHAPDAPTILFYGHYDVQPVDPLELWESPPFEATVRDGEIYARGAADDKGQVFMHLKAIEAHLAREKKLPVNIKLIVEGEEEVGSEHLDDFVRANKGTLAADVVVISDSAMFDRGVPSICYSLRGLTYFQIDVRGTKSDLHSGVFGGAVANPAMVLAQILAQMKDRGGRIKIPGFYDDVRALSDEERAAWEKLPFNEKKYRKDLGAPKLFGESGYSTLERVWARPTFEVNGLLSGFTGDGAAERSRMEIALRPAQVELEVDQAAKPVADRRNAAVEHRRVGDDDHVGGEILLVGANEVVEVDAADFLFALDEEPDIDGQAARLLDVRLDRLDVHEHLALVVRRPARVDFAVANRGFKGGRGPEFEGVDRLNVVVPVIQDRRLAWRAKPVAVHHRMTGGVDQRDVLHAGAAQRLRRPLGGTTHVGVVLGQRADARDRQVLLQFVDIAIAIDVDEVKNLIHGSMICHASKVRRATPSCSSFTR